ncbi:MAG: DNA recombination protein RmuC [Elusimicrobia bacterium]|nr:DNA recombination protein RmuC [Elusimicrobiota bacterium]
MSALTLLFAMIAGAAVSGVVFYLVFFSSRKNDGAARLQMREDFRQLLDLAEQKFETERARQKGELEEKKAAVESAVAGLAERLKSYEELVHKFETDRAVKYGSLEKGLKDAAEQTAKLASSTEGLRSLLDNSRARGQWGERMADDILRASGLQEGVQYRKNKALDTSSSRPDFTFLLPDGKTLNMDVKFPLDNWLRFSHAVTDDDRARLKKDFERDVKARVKELQKRDYVNPGEGTLDYVLLFIPNEQVYAFIQEAFPGLVDEALSQKVVMCSPFTLYAVLGVVRQAFDHFHFTQATQEVLKLIGQFGATYETFKTRFTDFGEKLGKLSELYADIEQKSFKRLDASVAKIDRVRKGDKTDAESLIAGLPDSDPNR